MKDIPSVKESVFAASFFDTKWRPEEPEDPISLRTTSLVSHSTSRKQKKQETAPLLPSPLFSAQYAEPLAVRNDPINVTGSYNPETQQWSSYNDLWNWTSWTTTCVSDSWEEKIFYFSTGNENMDGDCGQGVLYYDFDNMETED